MKGFLTHADELRTVQRLHVEGRSGGVRCCTEVIDGQTTKELASFGPVLGIKHGIHSNIVSSETLLLLPLALRHYCYCYLLLPLPIIVPTGTCK